MLEASDMPAEQRPLHLLNRLGFGPRPGDVERVKAIGPERYIHEQLHPESIKGAGIAEGELALDMLARSPASRWAENVR